MAQRTVVVVVDDLTEEPLAEGQGQSVRFGLDGTDYEIDLSKEHAEELRAIFKRYIEAGRRVGQQRRSRGAAGRSQQGTVPSGRQDRRAIREWARAHGFEVSPRGRIPISVRQAHDAAS